MRYRARNGTLFVMKGDIDSSDKVTMRNSDGDYTVDLEDMIEFVRKASLDKQRARIRSMSHDALISFTESILEMR